MTKILLALLIICTFSTIWAHHHHRSSSSSSASSDASDYSDYSSEFDSDESESPESDEFSYLAEKKLKSHHKKQMKCSSKEVFRSCSSMCEPKCGQEHMDMPCIDMCGPPKCQCIPGLLRDPESGKCVAPKHCPLRCHKKHEVVNPCGGCEGTCTNPRPMCTKICAAPKCRCTEGYVRGPCGHCIRLSKCPSSNSTCPKANEEWKECASSCEATCNNPSPICTMECRPAKCQCKLGFVRDAEGNCIDKEQCGINACAAMLCAAGTQCKLVPVQCVRAPCPPVAQCVPIVNNNGTAPAAVPQNGTILQ